MAATAKVIRSQQPLTYLAPAFTFGQLTNIPNAAQSAHPPLIDLPAAQSAVLPPFDLTATIYQKVKAWITGQEIFQSQHLQLAPVINAQRLALLILRAPPPAVTPTTAPAVAFGPLANMPNVYVCPAVDWAGKYTQWEKIHRLVETFQHEGSTVL